MAKSWKGFLHALGMHLGGLDLGWLRSISESEMTFKLKQDLNCYNVLNIMASIFKISSICFFYFCEASQISGA